MTDWGTAILFLCVYLMLIFMVVGLIVIDSKLDDVLEALDTKEILR